MTSSIIVLKKANAGAMNATTPQFLCLGELEAADFAAQRIALPNADEVS